MSSSTGSFQIEPGFEPLLRKLGIASAGDVFSTPLAHVWRSIRERENATIDPPGGGARLHMKRDKLALAKHGAAAEARGILVLARHGIPTATLVAHGTLDDGRSFAITEDLTGFQPADRLIQSGCGFDTLSPALAAVAGKMHRLRLFHQDLYLCHFFVKLEPAGVDVRMIDLARLLERPFCWARWHIKDLAQFVYSTRGLPITESQLDTFFGNYGKSFGKPVTTRTRALIAMKANRIARHDLELHRRQPDRDVSLPG